MQVSDAEIRIDSTSYTSVTFNPLGFIIFDNKKAIKTSSYDGCTLIACPPLTLIIKDKQKMAVSLIFSKYERCGEIRDFLESKIGTKNEGRNQDSIQIRESPRRSLKYNPQNIDLSALRRKSCYPVIEHQSLQEVRLENDQIVDIKSIPDKCGLYDDVQNQHNADRSGNLKVSNGFSNNASPNKRSDILPKTRDTELENPELMLEKMSETKEPPIDLVGTPHKSNEALDIDKGEFSSPSKRPSIFKKVFDSIFLSSGKRGSIFSNKSSKTDDSTKSGVSIIKNQRKIRQSLEKQLLSLYRLIRLSQKLKCDYNVKVASIEASYFFEMKLGEYLDVYKEIGTKDRKNRTDLDEDRNYGDSFDINITEIVNVYPNNNEILHDIDFSLNDGIRESKESTNPFLNLDKNVKDVIKRKIALVGNKLSRLTPDLGKAVNEDETYNFSKHTNILLNKFKQYKDFIENRQAAKFDSEMQVYMIKVDLQFFIDLAKNLVAVYDELLFTRAAIILDRLLNFKLSIIVNQLIAFKQAFLNLIRQQVVYYCNSSPSAMRRMYGTIFSFVNYYWFFDNISTVPEKAFDYMFGIFDEVMKHIQTIHQSISIYPLS